MRQQFYDELSQLDHILIEMADRVATAMHDATDALLRADLPLAEKVIADDPVVNDLRHNFEDRAFAVIARQQPVAGDLRALVAGLRIASDLERSGDLAVHIAKLTRLKYPRSAIPPEARTVIGRMGEEAELIIAKAGRVIAARDPKLAGELEADDDVMDELHRQLLALMIDDSWPYRADVSIDLALAGRFYERFADHAVSIARRVIYLATGAWDVPE